MLQLWKRRTFSEKLLEFGKQKRGIPTRQAGVFPTFSECLHHRWLTSNFTGHQHHQGSLSVMQAGHTSPTSLTEPSSFTLINADSRKLTPRGPPLQSWTCMGIMTVNHTLIVVEKLFTPVNLGCDFLTKHGVILDFNTGTFNTATSAQEGKIHLDDGYPKAMPSKATSSPPRTLDMPTEYHPALRQVL